MTEPLTSRLVQTLHETPDVYLHKLDLLRNVGLLVQLDAAAYRAASFLDDRVLTPKTQGRWVTLAQIADAAQRVPESLPVHFIFHTGHVGSTLISRLLDETNCVLSLREPLPLRTLAQCDDALGRVDSLLSQPQYEALRRTLLRLWRRGYADSRATIVKATSSAGRIAASLLASSEASRAFNLNMAAESYLATLLAGKNSPVDLRGHGAVRIRGLQSRLDTPLAPLHALSIGELAAMSWLAETFNQHDAASVAGERVLAMDFELFLSDVRSGMDRILEHFELPRESAYLSAVARSPVLKRYSKASEFAYSPEMRAEILRESRVRNAAEIRQGLAWLEHLAKSEDAVAAIL